jgi:hypothetical protein
MYFCFDKEGVLNIKPETHSDVMTLKWFIKEFAAHGNRMINIETELDQESESQGQEQYYKYTPVENAFGYSPQSKDSWYEDVPPFSPRSFYDNDKEDDYRVVYPFDREYSNRYYIDNRRGRGGRGGSGGGSGRGR